MRRVDLALRGAVNGYDGDLFDIETAIKNGGDLNMPVEQLLTVLQCALKKGDTVLIEYLISKGIEVTNKDLESYEALIAKHQHIYESLKRSYEQCQQNTLKNS